jgi:hypothetical protein
VHYQQILMATLLITAGLLVSCDSPQTAATPTPTVPLETAQPATAPAQTIPPVATASPITQDGGSSLDYIKLLEGLGFSGAKVGPAGTVSQPFFTPQGQVISIEGQDVQVFEYESVAEAEAEAALIAPDGGSVGTSMVSWMATPHFYKDGRLIVLYVGDENDVINWLDIIFGSRFAGG